MVERTILTVSSILPNEIKYFGTDTVVPPNKTYQWFLYAVNTRTMWIGVNDLSNGGIRLKNNSSNAINDAEVELYWFTVG
jgi:hypothetical protein